MGLETWQSRRHYHLQLRPLALQLGSRRHDVGQHVADLLAPRCWHQQQYWRITAQPKLTAGLLLAWHFTDGVQQRMAHIGDIGATTAIEAGLLLKNRQDLICEADQIGAAAVAEFESPLLRCYVVSDRHLGKSAFEPQPQAHIGSHVVDQHHAIGRVAAKPMLQAPLQPQGRQHKGNRLQQANSTYAGGVSQQYRTGALHALATKGHDLEIKLAAPGLLVQGLDQQRSLQIPRHLTGAHQQPQHQRVPGIGPRREGPMEASRKLQSWSAAPPKGWERNWLRASARVMPLR